MFLQLLLYLKQFSSNIISRTTELEKQVNTLSTETKGTDTRMNNMFNDFLMLSNIQFVESVSLIHMHMYVHVCTVHVNYSIQYIIEQGF